MADIVERLREACRTPTGYEMSDHSEPWGVDCGLLRDAATELEALRKRCEAVEAALRDCLQAMDVARDTIQPITQAQVKLHGLDPATANKLDAAASKALAAIAAAQDPSHG